MNVPVFAHPYGVPGVDPYDANFPALGPSMDLTRGEPPALFIIKPTKGWRSGSSGPLEGQSLFAWTGDQTENNGAIPLWFYAGPSEGGDPVPLYLPQGFKHLSGPLGVPFEP